MWIDAAGAWDNGMILFYLSIALLLVVEIVVRLWTR